MSHIYSSFNGCTLQNNEIKKTCKTDIALNYKIINIFDKTDKKENKKNNHVKQPDIKFNIDDLFKIYTEFNNNDIDFID